MPVPASLLETTPTPSALGPLTAARERVPGSTGPILVATTGTADTDAAVRLAWQLAGRTGADVQLLTALEPVAPLDVQFSIMPPPPGELLAAQRDEQLAQVRAQLCRAAPTGCEWPVAAADGPADEVIARVAADEGARAVVVGRGRHGAVGRAVSGETVLRILRRTDVPVYAVEPEADGLARRVIVALDFSPYSVYAARVALDLVAPDAVVTLAHVWPRVPALAPALTGWAHEYQRAIPALFDRARGELAAPESVQIETVTLSGRSPGRAVIDFATAAKADLVVSATHGHGFFTRLVLGSVATELLRGAPCSFLCVPGSAATHAVAHAAATAQLLTETVRSTDWEAELRGLSERHVGGLCALATAPAGGTPRGEVGAFPLAEIAYAPDTRTVALLFGTAGEATPPLTYVVGDVTVVDRLVDATGAVRALRVAGASGEALLRFL